MTGIQNERTTNPIIPLYCIFYFISDSRRFYLPLNESFMQQLKK